MLIKKKVPATLIFKLFINNHKNTSAKKKKSLKSTGNVCLIKDAWHINATPPLFGALVHKLDSSQNSKSISQLYTFNDFLTEVLLGHRRSMPTYPGAHSDDSEWTCCKTKHEKKQNENSWFCSAHQTLPLNIFSIANLSRCPPLPSQPFPENERKKRKALRGQLAASDFLGANSAARLRDFGDASMSRLAICRPFGALRVFAHLDCALCNLLALFSVIVVLCWPGELRGLLIGAPLFSGQTGALSRLLFQTSSVKTNVEPLTDWRR